MYGDTRPMPSLLLQQQQQQQQPLTQSSVAVTAASAAAAAPSAPTPPAAAAAAAAMATASAAPHGLHLPPPHIYSLLYHRGLLPGVTTTSTLLPAAAHGATVTYNNARMHSVSCVHAMPPPPPHVLHVSCDVVRDDCNNDHDDGSRARHEYSASCDNNNSSSSAVACHGVLLQAHATGTVLSSTSCLPPQQQEQQQQQQQMCTRLRHSSRHTEAWTPSCGMYAHTPSSILTLTPSPSAAACASAVASAAPPHGLVATSTATTRTMMRWTTSNSNSNSNSTHAALTAAHGDASSPMVCAWPSPSCASSSSSSPQPRAPPPPSLPLTPAAMHDIRLRLQQLSAHTLADALLTVALRDRDAWGVLEHVLATAAAVATTTTTTTTPTRGSNNDTAANAVATGAHDKSAADVWVVTQGEGKHDGEARETTAHEGDDGDDDDDGARHDLRAAFDSALRCCSSSSSNNNTTTRRVAATPTTQGAAQQMTDADVHVHENNEGGTHSMLPCVTARCTSSSNNHTVPLLLQPSYTSCAADADGAAAAVDASDCTAALWPTLHKAQQTQPPHYASTRKSTAQCVTVCATPTRLHTVLPWSTTTTTTVTKATAAAAAAAAATTTVMTVTAATRAFDTAQHPCLYWYGSCRHASCCVFVREPRNLCLSWVRGGCAAGDGCTGVHRLPPSCSTPVRRIYALNHTHTQQHEHEQQQQQQQREQTPLGQHAARHDNTLLRDLVHTPQRAVRGDNVTTTSPPTTASSSSSCVCGAHACRAHDDDVVAHARRQGDWPAHASGAAQRHLHNSSDNNNNDAEDDTDVCVCRCLYDSFVRAASDDDDEDDTVHALRAASLAPLPLPSRMTDATTMSTSSDAAAVIAVAQHATTRTRSAHTPDSHARTRAHTPLL